MDKEEVLNLAKLARVELRDEEAESLSHEFDSILNYVGEVKKVDKLDKLNKFNKEESTIRNVMRKDGKPHDPGLYTQKILAQAPAKEGDYIKVKKIL
ncbi:MAG: Aspartyl/glutamyl-tRNA(Asn/Gln) amidotransferase subunit C [Parcubacteria group bacterium GW2011_GWA2_45_15]|nr:MAG: Aspartyl/glutamyl-tRNA(Asn/Gln) amidotransferase subunit C [Parcubacteria group bacterium GW2011_GWA2_45_15]